MDDFWNDVRELAASPVASDDEARSVFDLFSELIAQEIPGLDPDACERCCLALVHSKAYQSNRKRSQDQVLSLLLNTDPLHKHEVEFVGTVILSDSECMQALGQSTDAIEAVINCIWMFRFTQPRIVEKYMLILVAVCLATQLEDSILVDFITSSFVLFLFRTIRDNDEALSSASLMVILALNHQYMLRDMHGEENKVFWELQQSPQQYNAIGSALVMLLNRSRVTDAAIKLITGKFFYLLFTSKQTADLLYINDLNVLLSIVLRELNDLPTECVQTREMLLRVLHAMLVNSPIEHNNPGIRSTIVQTLRFIIEHAFELDHDFDQAEILRLADRCLAVKWLRWNSSNSASSSESEDSEEEGETMQGSPMQGSPLYRSNSSPARQTSSSPTHHRRPPPPPPPPHHSPSHDSRPYPYSSSHSKTLPSLPLMPPQPPTPPRSRLPPPPPPPRHMSVESVTSEDSQTSMDFVDHLRPPAPPSRKSLRMQTLSANGRDSQPKLFTQAESPFAEFP